MPVAVAESVQVDATDYWLRSRRARPDRPASAAGLHRHGHLTLTATGRHHHSTSRSAANSGCSNKGPATEVEPFPALAIIHFSGPFSLKLAAYAPTLTG